MSATHSSHDGQSDNSGSGDEYCRDRLNPEERAMRARLAAHTSWANTSDRSARTAPARRAFMKRFEDQVDPDRKLSPHERAQRAEHAMKAHMTRAALKSAQARRRRAS
jgi:hypothetical protein